MVKAIAALSVMFFLMEGIALALAPFLCRPIQPGETLQQAAQRLTGSSYRVYDARFQVVDPATSRIVAKAHYDLVRPGWLACVVDQQTATSSMPGVRRSGAVTVARTAWGAGVGFLVTLSGMVVVQRYSRKTRCAIEQMNRFGDKFLREFGRPLGGNSRSELPVRFRLRPLPHRDRMEILIAPGCGHQYPNLSDHRKNVEYDIDRIMRGLRDEPFVSREPYAHGSWVVIPFELKPNHKTEGAA
jgi:hypothetical protein